MKVSQSVTKALPSAVRTHNSSAVLKLLYRGAMSRADVARELGLTRVVVSDIVADLIEDGLVVEHGVRDAKGPGKRGRMLHLDEDSRSLVVLDLSQPHVLGGAVMNLAGRVLGRLDEPVDGEGAADVRSVVRLCEDLAQRAETPLLGVGISCPGIVRAQGVVAEATNLGWHEVNLRSRVAGALGVPVFVENDANAEAVAEWRFGEGGPDLLLLQLSNGIGAGLMLSGHLVTGCAMQAGEIGHVVVEPGGRPCNCGKRGCLEAEVNAPLLLHDIRERADRRDAILARAGRYLGRALCLPVALVDVPEVMVLGDSRVVGRTLLDAMQQELNAAVSTRFRKGVSVRRSTLGDDANLLGACALVLDHWLEGGEGL